MGFLEELFEQPNVFQALFDKEIGQILCLKVPTINLSHYTSIVLTGMGSSYCAAMFGALYLLEHNKRTFYMQAGELADHFNNLIEDKTLVIAISQSGESMETVSLVSQLDGENCLAVTNNPISSLGRLCKLGTVQIHAGEERTTATKTYTNTLASLLTLCNYILGYSEQGLEHQARAALREMQRIFTRFDAISHELAKFFRKARAVVTIGTGTSLPTAYHGAFVLGEMTRTPTTASSVGQFFHGLIEQVDEEFYAIFFDANPDVNEQMNRAIGAVLEHGGKVLVVSNMDKHKLENANFKVISYSGVDKYFGSIVEVLPLEFMAYQLSVDLNYAPGELNRVKK